MDPLGLALENYDAVGKWRTKDGGADVDPTGTLTTGEIFNNPAEFRAIIAGKQTEFRRALASKMLIFALGRGLEPYDKCAINDICSEVTRNENHFSSVVQAIVKSRPFQYRNGPAK